MLVEEFFLGPGKTALANNEMLLRLTVPPSVKRGGAYMRHTTREAMDIAVVGVGAIVQLGENNGLCEDSKICLGAVAPVPIRAHNAEGILKGKEITDELVEEAA